MTLRTATRFLQRAAATAAILLAVSPGAFAQATRLGATSFPGPYDGSVRRFPSVAYDPVNNAYLVTWSIHQIGARFVSPDGAPLGSPALVVGAGGGGVRAACGGPAINACLIAWVEEPTTIKGRFVRYNGGAVQFLTNPFVIDSNGRMKLTSNAATVAYSSAANEFLVAWTEFGPSGGPDVTARRVAASGAPLGGEIAVAWTSAWEGFPSATYNSANGQFLVAYYFEPGSSNVSTQRVQSGSGALVGGRSTLYGSSFEQYPEIAYNSVQNQYLAITWGIPGGWMLHGGLADGNAQPISGILSLAPGGGGDGIGLAYNPVRNTYFAVYQSVNNAEVWGVEIGANGIPGSQFQVTVSGTGLSVQPRVAASTLAPRWYAVASADYAQIMGQLVGSDGAPPSGGTSPPPPSSGCTTIQPGPDWVCVDGNWLPPGSGGGGTTTPPPPPPPTSSCTTAQPVAGWVCVDGNWLPPDHPLVLAGGGGTTAPPPPPPPPTSSCTTPQPAADWVCVDGNWLPQSMVCPTQQPVAGWVCVAGNWLPPDHPDATGGGGGGGTVAPQPASSCTTPSPGDGWFCYNGNWLPPGYPIGDDD